MNNYEKKLFWSLVKYDNDCIDESLFEYATPEVLGYLFFNRMQGVAYGVLKKNKATNKINREFRNSLKNSFEINLERNNSYYYCVKYLSDLLAKTDGKIAFLKGAKLCFQYPEGYRTSNDVDLLVSPEDISNVGDLLLSENFKQGYIKDGAFLPATRSEIISSKMLRGETVPYIKEVNLPRLKYLEVDINFSLDYKNSNNFALNEMINSVETDEMNLPSLSKYDFLIHLCVHLYKEATTLPWVKMQRDMTLYKYEDIYMLVNRISGNDIISFWERAERLSLHKECAFAISQTYDLFQLEKDNWSKKAQSYLKEDEDFLHTVVSPLDKKIYIYKNKNVNKRFFDKNRISNLQELQTKTVAISI